jgi:hypothetical protein
MSLVPKLNTVYFHNDLNTPGFINLNWLFPTPTRPNFMTTKLLVPTPTSYFHDDQVTTPPPPRSSVCFKINLRININNLYGYRVF